MLYGLPLISQATPSMYRGHDGDSLDPVWSSPTLEGRPPVVLGSGVSTTCSVAPLVVFESILRPEYCATTASCLVRLGGLIQPTSGAGPWELDAWGARRSGGVLSEVPSTSEGL